VSKTAQEDKKMIGVEGKDRERNSRQVGKLDIGKKKKRGGRRKKKKKASNSKKGEGGEG